MATKLRRDKFKVVLLDKNNYYTFQPLLYKVATAGAGAGAGLEPDSITHPIRTIIKNKENFYFRLANVYRIDPQIKKVYSNMGDLSSDYLIIATGSTTNFFGHKNIERYAFPIKSVMEAIKLRSLILQSFETALFTKDVKERDRLMTFVIAGVEIYGALSELKNFIFPKDYPDLDISRMSIHIIQATFRLVDGMSQASSDATLNYLKKSGVNMMEIPFI
ncbi:MAG: NAD(P)/FAD-dependent oxidoreductase [Candidatus Walczuchella monophlebidarum]